MLASVPVLSSYGLPVFLPFHSLLIKLLFFSFFCIKVEDIDVTEVECIVANLIYMVSQLNEEKTICAREIRLLHCWCLLYSSVAVLCLSRHFLNRNLINKGPHTMPVLCLRKLRWPGSQRDGLGIKGSGSNFNQGHCMMFFGETRCFSPKRQIF